jgi:hypothetical protein
MSNMSELAALLDENNSLSLQVMSQARRLKVLERALRTHITLLEEIESNPYKPQLGEQITAALAAAQQITLREPSTMSAVHDWDDGYLLVEVTADNVSHVAWRAEAWDTWSPGTWVELS